MAHIQPFQGILITPQFFQSRTTADIKVTEKVSSAKSWLFQLYKCIIREKERRDTSAESDCTNRNVFIAIRR
ncbi:MAG: hypothetical protein IJR97_02090, partial [Clostridia bacterium]|nr:hypothetical protein [Clostridia bacterium]